ncbi:MAG TPA: thioredoxin-disulfide reductase [Phycisphaerae bacterium]|nr:thioredoxin-disulfide reductase [Phycisphaerae bacterium]
MAENVEKTVIIGSGPAGWTAAIYSARANLNPLVLTGDSACRERMPGGQLMFTSDVENYPGFADGVDGPAMMDIMQRQAVRFGTRVKNNYVNKIDLKTWPFKVWHVNELNDEGESMVLAHSVIVSTGASANYLGLESEKKFENNGVSACAVCDGSLPRFRNVPVVVVGGGDTAAEEAVYLAKFASVVYLVHRRNELRASRIMAQRVLSHPKIKPVWDSVVEEILGTNEHGVNAVVVKNVKTGKLETIECGGMFAAIGHTPNTGFLKGQIELNEIGYIVLKVPFRTFTSVEGVFAAGDCADSIYRQAITAAGMGCRAAIDAERWLCEKGIH